MPEKVWSLVAGLSIESAYWDRQWILFNNLSGDTHMLNESVDWVLDQIGPRPLSLNELIDLAIRQGITGEERDNREVFASLLESLEKIDLVESSPA